MIHPIPPGTRDVLPDEMRELRRLHLALIDVFERYGYGEVRTPTIEYDEVLARGDGRAAGSAYRFFDEQGDLLALRSDMTIPIARMVASGHSGGEPPHRLCYLAPAYRAVRPQRGQMREFTQGGVELIGAAAPEGTAEVVEVLGGGTRRRRADPRGDRARRRRPLPPGARRARRRGRGPRGGPAAAGDARHRRARALPRRAPRGRRARRRDAGRPEPAAGRGGGAGEGARAGRAAVERAGARIEQTYAALGRARGGRAGADRPRPAARPRLLQRRHPRGL